MSKARRSSLDLKTTLDHLRSGRQAAMLVSASCKPGGERYLIAQRLYDAVDAMAEELTGNPDHFKPGMTEAIPPR